MTFTEWEQRERSRVRDALAGLLLIPADDRKLEDLLDALSAWIDSRAHEVADAND